jgi:sugar lactone lactonase YvrE
VSLVTPAGEVGRLVAGLPSSRDSGDLAGVNTVALSPSGDEMLLGNFGQGHLWILALTAEQQNQGLTVPDQPVGQEQLVPALRKLNNVFLTNPFDIAFDGDGIPVVSDASGNGVAKENPDGTVRFFHRFDPLPDPTSAKEKVTIQAVPTGLTRIGREYYVTLTGGCPYPEGGGQLVAIDEHRNQRVIVDRLNMPIDVAQGPDGTIWVLEFARFKPGASCFTGEGYQPETGRLSQLQPDGSLKIKQDGLNFPGAVLPLPDGSVYISDVFGGRVLHISFP